MSLWLRYRSIVVAVRLGLFTRSVEVKPLLAKLVVTAVAVGMATSSARTQTGSVAMDPGCACARRLTHEKPDEFCFLLLLVYRSNVIHCVCA